MFTKSRPLFHSFQKLTKYKLKIVAISLCFGGMLLTLQGFSTLEAVSSQEYELQPVMTQCPDAPIPNKELLYVDVSGAVKKPGLYELEQGSRIGDALKVAGGIVGEADARYVASQLNAAELLKDGDKVFVPHKDENNNGQTQNNKTANTASSTPNLISINNASAKKLTELPQIGEKRAEDIVANRPYQSVDDLVAMEIISETIFEGLADLITL